MSPDRQGDTSCQEARRGTLARNQTQTRSSLRTSFPVDVRRAQCPVFGGTPSPGPVRTADRVMVVDDHPIEQAPEQPDAPPGV